MKTPKILTLLSGVIDSLVLSDLLLKEKKGTQVAIFVDYGHKAAAQEWRAVRAFVRGRMKIEKVSIRVGGARLKSQLMTGYLKDRAFLPGRNLLLLLAAGWKACELKADFIAVGLRDNAEFPDSSEIFVRHFSNLSFMAFGRQLTVLAPLMHMTKADVVKLGRDLGTRLLISYSCYMGKRKPCGRCRACEDRKGLV